MNRIHSKTNRLLAIAPSTKGFGFAVLEGQESLVDWGVRTVKGDKNKNAVLKVKELIAHYQPEVLVMEDYSAKGSRRCGRIQVLGRKIIAMASSRKVKVTTFSRQQVRRLYFNDGTEGTKHALAEILGKRFPEELGYRIPPKRRAWMSQDSRMDIFDAVALVLAPGLRKEKRDFAH